MNTVLQDLDEPDTIGRATYSPEDNKIRIYPDARLAPELYARVKAAGFGWAPKQGIFVAPMWTPARADLAAELCGDLGDEDTTLTERAEERADRFAEYSDKRADDATRAREHVAEISGHIPFGQPVLIGHHSQRRAERDAAKIQNGMRHAVKMWETSKYWTDRAAGALAHAKYKELPAVRARRIKGIEADKRKQERTRTEAEKALTLWKVEVLPHEIGNAELTHKRALAICNYYSHISLCFKLADYPRDLPASQYEGMMGLWSALEGGVITAEQARDISIPRHESTIAWCDRWIAHYANRLAYERAMLAEGGATAPGSFNLQIGGQVLHRFGWGVITRINRKDGEICSVSTVGKYARVVQVEDIKEYKDPEAGDPAKVRAATKLAPMCNYEVPGCARMTQAEYKAVYADHKSGCPIAATAEHAAHRVRVVSGFLGRRHGATGQTNQWHSVHVFLTDAKVKAAPSAENSPPVAPTLPVPEQDGAEAIRSAEAYRERAIARQEQEEKDADFKAMRDGLRTGQTVQVVSAPQLFPTPPDLAARMVEELGIEAGDVVLEPSAGTGNLLTAIMNDDTARAVVAVEINATLADRLRREYPLTDVHNFDFLTYERSSKVDRIVMNPPFQNGDDIKHIKHALTMLKEGGRLVALCANGPRQRDQLMPLCQLWEDLPAGTFAAQGTMVNVALLIIEG